MINNHIIYKGFHNSEKQTNEQWTRNVKKTRQRSKLRHYVVVCILSEQMTSLLTSVKKE